ncbi:Rab3 GTPase-activating protein catalytic subunit-domain-containing protein [Hyaloraphidium curvatum]|nr:Rab3 GTPase-activating protein catalytic subunit-domain-containing protein [Hyaloraphidium curvatum]
MAEPFGFERESVVPDAEPRDDPEGADEEGSEDEEVFEIVDYTAASPWERFITSIEQALTNWHVGDGSLGVLDPAKRGDEEGDADVRVRSEVVRLGDAAYTLSYHAFCPVGAWVRWEEPEPRPDELAGCRAEFPPTTSAHGSGPQPHVLHRQTGLTHFLTLAAADSEPTFDLSTNRLLASSLSVALHNTACSLPAFVPQGPSRRALYTGTMLAGGTLGDVEVKFRSYLDGRGTKLVTPADLVQLAEARLDLETENDLSTFRDTALMTALFTYLYKPIVAPPLSPSTSRALPPLPIGTRGTSLAILKLECHFPSLSFPPSDDPADPDPSAAPLWLLGRDWRPSSHRLAEVVELLVSEWLAARERESSEGSGRRRPSSRLGAAIETFAANMVGLEDERSSGEPMAIVETTDVYATARALLSWDSYERKGSRWSPSAGPAPRGPSHPPTTEQLVARAPGGTTVPLDSLFWQLAHRLLDCASPQTSLSYRHTSVASFLRATWAELLDALERCWNEGAYVPGVNWAGDPDPDDLDDTDGEGDAGGTARGDAISGAAQVPSVDLRRALVHQKLEMLNCCVHTRNRRVGLLPDGEGGGHVSGRRRSSELVDPPDAGVGSPTPGGWRSKDDEETDVDTGRPTLLGWKSGMGLREKGADLTKRLLGFGAENRAKDPGSADPLVKLFDHIAGDDPPGPNDEDDGKGTWGEILSSVQKATDGSGPGTPTSAAEPVPRSVATERRVDGWSGDEAEDDEQEDSSGEEEGSQTGDVFYETMEDVPSSPKARRARRKADRARIPSEDVEASQAPGTARPPASQPRPFKARRRDMDPISPVSSSISDSHNAFGASYRSDSFIEVENNSSLESRPRPAMQQVSPTLLIDDEQDEQERSHDEGPVEGELVDEDERAGGSHVLLDAAGKPVMLINGASEVWVPIVQEAGHMTEDMVQTLEERLERLGHGQEAAKARAELQTAHLKSDMEAFKAANPRASLEDFVRWHSPRDCVETTDSDGNVVGVTLSHRMLEPGNLWLDLWKRARRVPAANQEPLFDYETEARRVLDDLGNLGTFDLLTQLLPTVFFIAYDTLSSHACVREIPQVKKAADHVAKLIAHIPWDHIRWGDLEEVKRRFANVLSAIQDLEDHVARANDMLLELPDQYSMVERLLSGTDTVVQDGPERDAVWQLFSEGDLLRSPSSREFVLRATAARGGATASSMQRFYFLLKDGEARVMEVLSRPGNF